MKNEKDFLNFLYKMMKYRSRKMSSLFRCNFKQDDCSYGEDELQYIEEFFEENGWELDKNPFSEEEMKKFIKPSKRCYP